MCNRALLCAQVQIVPQSPTLNRGAYNQFEGRCAREDNLLVTPAVCPHLLPTHTLVSHLPLHSIRNCFLDSGATRAELAWTFGYDSSHSFRRAVAVLEPASPSLVC